MQHLTGISPRVGHHHINVPALKFAHQIGHFAVANVGAVFLEGDTQHSHRAACHIDTVVKHALDHIAGCVAGHVVVDSTPRQYDLGMVAQFFGLVGKIVWVNPDAGPANHAWPERQKVPFAASGF